jgi:uncharacterized damage-inducible protein DinB
MSISLERALAHMSWANQEIFKLIADLPDHALDSYATDPEWTVREILRHIAAASGGYAFRLDAIENPVLEQPKNMAELREITKTLEKSDARLIKLIELEDKSIEVIRNGKTVNWMRSTIITQAVHHATEHRAQAISALEARGFKAVNLDDFDVWAFEIHQRTLAQ